MADPEPQVAPALPPALVVRGERGLEEVIARCAGAAAIALDVEADGLFAYRPKLCTVQLAWEESGRLAIAVIDALAVRIQPLAAVFGSAGPVKVLHDLTFDARMLQESGVLLARVRDTSVAARLLGFEATGLASLLESQLGKKIDKRFQQHDWARRPLTEEQIRYLEGDVGSLLELDAVLAARATALDIAEEIAEECAYKLASALAPPRDTRPPYVRIRGAAGLDAVGRAVLRRLVEAREVAAADADVPPFKVVGNDALLELARKRPADEAGLRAVRGAVAGRAGRHVRAWAQAIAQGVTDADIPPEDRVHFEPARADRAASARRRAREGQISGWRRKEAAARGVDEQAILPGHCAQDLADAFVAVAGDSDALLRRIAEIPGFGPKRLARYGETLTALAAAPPEPPPRNADPPPAPDAPPEQ